VGTGAGLHSAKERAMSGDQHRDAGATLVEYVLGASLIIVFALGGIGFLSSRATAQASSQANCISTRPPPPSCVRTPVPATVAPTTTGVGPTTTLTPPSTDPSTTTTAPPQSTVAAGSVTIIGAANAPWSISLPMTVLDAGGQPLAGAVITGRVLLGRQPFNVGCTTDVTGTCNVTFGPIPAAQTTLNLAILTVDSTPPAALPLPAFTITRP